MRFSLLGAIIGAIVGVPVSYFFQSAIVRGKLSLGGYMEYLINGKLFEAANHSQDILTTLVIAVIICFLAGGVVGGLLKKSR